MLTVDVDVDVGDTEQTRVTKTRSETKRTKRLELDRIKANQLKTLSQCKVLTKSLVSSVIQSSKRALQFTKFAWLQTLVQAWKPWETKRKKQHQHNSAMENRIELIRVVDINPLYGSSPTSIACALNRSLLRASSRLLGGYTRGESNGADSDDVEANINHPTSSYRTKPTDQRLGRANNMSNVCSDLMWLGQTLGCLADWPSRRRTLWMPARDLRNSTYPWALATDTNG